MPGIVSERILAEPLANLSSNLVPDLPKHLQAFAFGADGLWGELDGKRTLPLLGSSGARRQEIEGLIARSGRRAVWADVPAPAALELESRS